MKNPRQTQNGKVHASLLKSLGPSRKGCSTVSGVRGGLLTVSASSPTAPLNDSVYRQAR